MNFSLIPPQRDREELLDLHRGSREEVRRSLRDITRINKYLGGLQLSVQGILDLLESSGKREATLLDIGTGTGDIPLQLQKQAARRGLQVRTIALDINARHLEIAQTLLPSEARVLLLRGDAFCLPFADQSIDVVHSSLFLHHFREHEIQALLREFTRVAKIGWVMNDIERHGLPIWFFRTTWPLYVQSYITRLDGVSSMRRAYTKAEMESVAAAVLGAQVERKFPFRLCVKWVRP